MVDWRIGDVAIRPAIRPTFQDLGLPKTYYAVTFASFIVWLMCWLYWPLLPVAIFGYYSVNLSDAQSPKKTSSYVVRQPYRTI